MVKSSSAGCAFASKTTLTPSQPTRSFIPCPQTTALCTETLVAHFPLHAAVEMCDFHLHCFPYALPLPFIRRDSLPSLPFPSPPLSACRVSKRSMMNIVNIPSLLKEINDSHEEGAALIAWLRGCGQVVLHEK